MAVKEKALRRLADKLNAAGVTWAIGGDWLMTQLGITDTYHTFDLVAAEQDLEKADKVLTRLGMRNQLQTSDKFCAEYHFDGADIHLRVGVAGFDFSAGDISGETTVLGATVHLLKPEACLKLAQLDGKNTEVWEKYMTTQE